MTEEQTLAVTEQNKGLAAMYADDAQDDLSQDDLVMPRILLAQSPSKYVKAEKAKPGQLVGSLEYDLVADRGETIEIIPFHRHKSFRLFKPQAGGGTPKFIAEVPYDSQTIDWERRRLREVDWTYTDLDKKEVTEKLSCFITWNYYVLLADQVESLPRVISFSSTSYTTGKKLSTFTLDAKKAGLPLPFHTYLIGTEDASNEKGDFYKLTVAKGRKTNDDELKNVHYWADLAKQGEIKVDDNIDGDESEVNEAKPTVQKGKVDANAEF